MPERTDHNEAMRLADLFELEPDPESLYRQAAALLRQLSAERDQLRAEVDELTHCLRAVLKGGDGLTGSQYAAVLNRAEAIAARTTHKDPA